MRTQESNAGSNAIEVKVCVLGGEVKTVALGQDATVEDALVAAELSTSVTVKCNGVEVSLGDLVDNGDKLIVVNKVKGGKIGE